MDTQHTCYTTYLFDMDGTLLNTLDDIRDAMNLTLRRWGLPPQSHDRVRDGLGNGARELVGACLPQGKSTPDFDAIVAAYKDYYDAHTCIKTAPYAGVTEMLAVLQRRGAKLAIVSNKPDFAAKELSARFFPGIPTFGDRDGMPRKPYPHMVNMALEALGADRDSAVYVGDSEVDVETARNSGLPLIAVSWGFRGRERLLAAGADCVVDSCAELTEITR